MSIPIGSRDAAQAPPWSSFSMTTRLSLPEDVTSMVRGYCKGKKHE